MENQVTLYQLLALFVPNSAGDSKALLRLTLQAVSQTIPLLSHLLGVVGRAKLSPVRIEQLFTDDRGKAAADVLKLLFNKFGSDKSTAHNYHHLYGEILKNRDDISYVLEIGLINKICLYAIILKYDSFVYVSTKYCCVRQILAKGSE